MWLHSLKVTQLLRSAAFLHTNQSRSYLNHLVCRLVGKIFVASSAEDDTSYRLRRGLLWKDTGPRRVAVVCVTEQAEPDILGANVHVYCDVNLLLSSGQAVGRCS